MVEEVNEQINERNKALLALKSHLERAQTQMQQYANKKRRGRIRVQTRKGIPMETERAVPNPRLVIDTSVRIQNGVASSTNERIIREHRQLSGWLASMACT
ncbi:hypothetical protein K1719_017812 [Acacia pycnantha]|nr:hypothetical protein K1719_017812 [Acacia pycnantha]